MGAYILTGLPNVVSNVHKDVDTERARGFHGDPLPNVHCLKIKETEIVLPQPTIH